MAIQQRKQSSIILTFKVLQFVNQLRRRVKPRRLEASIDPVHLGTDTSLGLNSISNGLSRISIKDAKQSRRDAHRVCKTRKTGPKTCRPSLRLQTPGSDVSAIPNVTSDEVQHMLSSVDGKLSPVGNAFSSIAGSNKLFLKHSGSPIFEGCSLNQTVQLLVTVQDAIDVLSDCRLQYGDGWLLAQGHDVGLNMDENFIANYEHMLLRLRAELIEALARKALEELLRGGHDKKQRKMLSWFTEFAEKPQPLSTSFPWTIKPSLAVLWGVCWMFYDSPPGEQAAKCGNDRVRQARVLRHLDFQWNAPASSDYLDLGRALIGTQPQHTAQQQTAGSESVGLDSDLFQARNTETWESDLSPMDFRLPNLAVSQAGVNRPPARAACQSTYYGAAQQQLPVVPYENNYLPHFQGNQPLTVYPHLGPDSLHNSWHPYSSLPQRSPRHQFSSPQTPSIQVTGAAESQRFTQPHSEFASFGGIYQLPRQPQASPLNLNPPFEFTHPPYMMGPTLPSDSTTVQAPQITIKHERTSSINSNSMPTPVSISGPHSPMLSPTSGEQMHLATSPHNHDRRDSVDSYEQDGDDDGSLRKNHSYKRAEEPPRNKDGKMMCRHRECADLFFDRKCEWSKHMDKHDRPYKCLVKGCEKLQGFTYSGGLLRHEREVHKMHGGTKKSLFCPFADCKRSSGAGFTRKENLAEHMRRVHRRTSMSADMHGLIIRRDIMERSPIPESRVASQSPYTRAIDFREDDELTLKRKRESDSGLLDRGNEEMRAEIKRLRQENEEKDTRLRVLEQAVTALQQNNR
ncbi:uncharacterized protein K460DRAFT_278146 [Cucurbitaria berberidis CBS 394.84]|uniref:C2H2-type domain-containing protein n=1 Tax=Cucurbitaria berberidis CBS 394.84 TaxID=1168544 RepID=A0A9P4GJT9_9PLEO|nr:uncharacterized protein K460DRAFT_278146 [Cucurbitaria berberidis CBS 394.84]KAF1846885.1 hypothetical protein K460DRAFT_278146 [Cucurbitaria berberidis CBS 394.84]